ncbi:MAG: UDP-N-acetylmuramoyl-L-alanine--D-glutamate ligase [Pseudomonadota bacterium]
MINLESEKGKKIGVFGLARTGTAAYVALKEVAKVICFDDNASNRKAFESTYGDSASALLDIEDTAWRHLDYIILSPGVPLHFPVPHRIVSLAKEYNIPLISDIEVLFRTLSKKNYIGVTGTNGKSTTTALIGHILGKDFEVGGNIGIPALALQEEARGFILELSSYQLDLLYDFKPKVAVLLNITPDHIERHGSLEGYIESKKRIWQNMGEGDALVIGVDNDVTCSIHKQLLREGVAFELIPISINKDSTDLPCNNFLQGLHNKENTLAAYATAKALGYSDEYIRSKIESFEGLKHRMQFVGTYKNISFYNDSKATNAESASKSIGSLENIYWIAGGVAKEGGIESLVPLFSRISKAYLYGEAREVFAKTLEGRVNFVICNSMQEAFDLALKDALHSNACANILLAPACASFDQFKDFEERGEVFISLARKVIADNH